MEGVAFSLLDGAEVLREMGVGISEMVACGGGRGVRGHYKEG
jgi:sugar (pentulose or hexulose) kinase